MLVLGMYYPKCPSYGLQVGTAWILRHLESKIFQNMVERRRQYKVAATSAKAME